MAHVLKSVTLSLQTIQCILQVGVNTGDAPAVVVETENLRYVCLCFLDY